MVNYVIMAHPSRARFVKQLADRLPDAVTVWDRIDNRWDTGRRSLLEGCDGKATHVAVIQDDALLSPALEANVAELVRYSGDRPVSLYTGSFGSAPDALRFLIERANKQGSPWVADSGPWWGVGLVIPTDHVPDLLDWADRRDEIENYDRRIGRWYQHVDVKCLYTFPSLVNHRPVTENPSLIEGRTANRQAYRFAEDETRYDWSKEPLVFVRQMSFRHRRNGRTVTVNTNSERFTRLIRSQVWSPLEEVVA